LKLWIHILIVNNSCSKKDYSLFTSLICKLKSRRRGRVRSSPDFNLCFTVFFSGFSFVKTLKCTIVSLIESPVFNHREMMAAKFVCNIIVCHNCSSQNRGVDDIEVKSILLESSSCDSSFLNTYDNKIAVKIKTTPSNYHNVNILISFVIFRDIEWTSFTFSR